MYVDLTGRKFGRLTVIKELESRYISGQKVRYWQCECECGNIIEVKSTSLTGKKRPTLSCGCLRVESTRNRHKDLTGKKFGKLTAIKMIEYDKNGRNLPNKWLCKCDCGNETIVQSTFLTDKEYGRKSCGCMTSEIISKTASETMRNRYENLEFCYDYKGKINKIHLFDLIEKDDIFDKCQSGEIKYCIYKATNIVNNMIYIGRTSRIKARIRQHVMTEVNDNQKFHIALKEYGLHNFKLEIIDYTNTYKKSVKKEAEWIAKLNSDNDTIGYNVSGKYSHNFVEIVQLTLNGEYVNEFNSINEAQRITKINNLSHCLNNPTRSSKNYMWVSKEFYNNLPKKYTYISR